MLQQKAHKNTKIRGDLVVRDRRIPPNVPMERKNDCWMVSTDHRSHRDVVCRDVWKSPTRLTRSTLRWIALSSLRSKRAFVLSGI